MSAASLPRCSRLGLDIPLQPLLDALSAIDEAAWQRHFNTGFYEGDWSGVALITPEDAPLPLAPGQGAPLATGLLERSAAWQAALGAFRTSIRSARLLRLGAGSRIHEHCDPDLGLADSDLRLHLPLLSAEGVEFLVDGLQVPMRPGECWFIDLARPHRVDNPGPGERIHLVLDCQRNDWLLALVEQGLAETPILRPGRAGLAFECFRALVAQDADLTQTLRSLTDTHAFVERVVALGAARDLHFSDAEVRTAMRRARQAWSNQWRA
ncbi:aspartyl/asparaginyl beta-hydroxylase domain-containing protein [Pseudomonas sp. PDNC002]|uniref:aspartyl/asparaginyl beta-hydroxylase domain-containing protein n=1 Tax=Pseudomonas sp. PDNC002 TaxID=2811422 RepID=UPI001966116E|nr:aspartyl/asparaginyl beta-hydroxylase domain-containing protein [Pseudomonas sp. PDNC002]QRY77346.1 aspartyl/asparaginyl beta-hydroxylase domain-containing protein [Pseudomonas sp. PDNC002]